MEAGSLRLLPAFVKEEKCMVKMMIVMRRDLHMRKGKIAAQAGHACVEALLRVQEKAHSGDGEREARLKDWLDTGEAKLKDWRDTGEAKVCVYLDGEEALLELHESLEAHRWISALIQDAGHTEFHGEPTFTCLGIEPLESEIVDAYTGELPLY